MLDLPYLVAMSIEALKNPHSYRNGQLIIGANEEGALRYWCTVHNMYWGGLSTILIFNGDMFGEETKDYRSRFCQ